jgi:hypothetical protein
MAADTKRRIIREWTQRAKKTVKAVVRDLARFQSLVGPHYLPFYAADWEARDAICALLALWLEWERLRRPRKPRRRARHPTPEEIARMGPRDRHFAEWDRARRQRIRRKGSLTWLENVKARFTEERWRETLADPNPDLEVYRKIERMLRAAYAERDRPLNN